MHEHSKWLAGVVASVRILYICCCCYCLRPCDVTVILYTSDIVLLHAARNRYAHAKGTWSCDAFTKILLLESRESEDDRGRGGVVIYL